MDWTVASPAVNESRPMPWVLEARLTMNEPPTPVKVSGVPLVPLRVPVRVRVPPPTVVVPV